VRPASYLCCWGWTSRPDLGWRSAAIWMRASSRLREETMLVRVPLSPYLFMQPRHLNAC